MSTFQVNSFTKQFGGNVCVLSPDHTLCRCLLTLHYYSIFLYKNKASVCSLRPEVQMINECCSSIKTYLLWAWVMVAES